MNLKLETVAIERGGILFLELPWRWHIWQRDIWSCCGAQQDAGVWVCRDCHATQVGHQRPHFCTRCRGRRLSAWRSAPAGKDARA